MSPPLSGLIAAPFTPFRSSGDVCLDTIPALADLLYKNEVSAAFVCGTTGEGSSLTTSERMEVAASWRAATPSGLKLVVHVGHLCLRDSQVLAQHACEIGADAIATIAPSFFKPAGAADLVAWCREVANAAPELPFYYYHMPAMTGVPISACEFLKEVKDSIPSLVGIKFTHEDLQDYTAAKTCVDGRYSMLFGRDEILLSGLQRGAPGAVGSTYNYAAPLYHRLMRAFADGDLASARAEQVRAQQFIAVMNRLGGLPAGKTIMKLIGVDCGPVRLPLRQLTQAEEFDLRAGLEACDFFSYASKA